MRSTKQQFSISRLFLIGAFIVVCMGKIIAWMFGPSAIDIHLHDTYFVIAHFHIIILVAIVLLIFAGVYYLFPRIFGRRMNYQLGLIHFVLTLLCVLMIFWPMHYEGIAGAPRRYYDYSAWESFRQFVSLNQQISFVALALVAAQFLFVVNFLISLFVGKRVLKVTG